MSRQYVRTGWANVTDTLCGAFVSLETDEHGESQPLLFGTQAEAETERGEYIEAIMEARRLDCDADAGELEALLEAELEALENSEWICFAGVDDAGDVYELGSPENLETVRQLQRSDREW
jgi:hypothetical protein